MKVGVEGELPKHLMERLEKDKPSAEPSYWAKKSCKHCFGRGVIGKREVTLKGNNKFRDELLCVCVRKKYQAWKEEKLDQYQAEARAKDKSNGNGNGAKKSEEQPKVSEDFIKRAKERVSRLDNDILTLKATIENCTAAIDEQPQNKQMDEIKAQECAFEDSIFQAEIKIETLKIEAEQYDVQAEKLRKRVKELVGAAARTRQEIKEREEGELVNLHQNLRTARTEYGVVLREFNRLTHQTKRRRRIAQQRLEKLEKRRDRVISESGLPPKVFHDSTPDELLEHR